MSTTQTLQITIVPPSGNIPHPRIIISSVDSNPKIKKQDPKRGRQQNWRYIDVVWQGTVNPAEFAKFVAFVERNPNSTKPEDEFKIIENTEEHAWAATRVPGQSGQVERWQRRQGSQNEWDGQLTLPRNTQGVPASGRLVAIGLWHQKGAFQTAKDFFAAHPPMSGSHKPDYKGDHHTVVIIEDDTRG